MKKWKRTIYAALILMTGLFLVRQSSRASGQETVYNSPYVTFSPDGLVWTTNAGDRNYTRYELGTTVVTGISSSLRDLATGEHYYKYDRSGTVPLQRWEVVWPYSQCIHHRYPEEDWHGISFERQFCEEDYYSGWNAYCADCGELVSGFHVYMSKEAAAAIDYLDVGIVDGKQMGYYYLCPWNNNLEQAVLWDTHECEDISWNQYRVIYEVNAGTHPFGGYMSPSMHMYNNAQMYEGNPVTPALHLSKNTYTLVGYEFVEWNTKPDGSGISYGDEAEVMNLSEADFHKLETWTDTDNGTITLYAQWRPSNSTLRIDPNGGSFDGSTDVTAVLGDYGSSYLLDSDKITPPAGYTVSFQTNGGKSIEPMTNTRHFTEWTLVQPFLGRLRDSYYYFIAPDKNIDTVLANYIPDPITLPTPDRENSSFGGWYYDEDFTLPAGTGGDMFIPDRDITLYAQWVELYLSARNNYKANGGKGAVDLTWTQPDGLGKVYMIYQSRDLESWNRINSADDIDSSHSVNQVFTYSGEEKTYTVPYTGVYTITAEGAQGGNYGSHTGGLGGQVSGKVWLEAGEVITYNIGGQNGYNGGGIGEMYGSGGGYTIVSTNQKDVILIAGGGGGATSNGDGGEGGSAAGLVSGRKGGDGGAGGGGGYQGGAAGEYERHYHDNSCVKEKTYKAPQSFYQAAAAINISYDDYMYDTYQQIVDFESYTGVSGYALLKGGKLSAGNTSRTVTSSLGNRSALIPTPNTGMLSFTLRVEQTGGSAGNGSTPWYGAGTASDYINVYDQNGGLIYSLSPFAGNNFTLTSGTQGDIGYRCEYGYNHTVPGWSGTYTSFDGKVRISGYGHSDANCQHYDSGKEVWGGLASVQDYNITVTVPISEDVTGCYAVVRQTHTRKSDNIGFESRHLAGGITYTYCSHAEGEVLSSLPAYGGSNYVNTAYTNNYTTASGVKSGNGSLTIQSELIGFIDELRLDDVAAKDQAAPDKVDEITLKKEALYGDMIKVTWNEPADNGTTYYHSAESYLLGSTVVLCRSNVTKNTLTTGIRGYYTVVDGNLATIVTEQNGTFSERPERIISLDDAVQYLHIAAADRAGNLSPTVHVLLDKQDGGLRWPLYTEQLEPEDGDNIYPAGNKTYYVRSDGETPFILNYRAYMSGTAREDYQINYAIFESAAQENTSRNILICAGGQIREGSYRISPENLTLNASGKSLMSAYPLTAAYREDSGRRLKVEQAFTLERAADGVAVELIPIAGADSPNGIVYSDYDADRSNLITVIGDGTGPVIHGLEALEGMELIDRRETSLTLQITAEDALSGVKDFYMEVYNSDNAVRKTYTPGNDGRIRADITEDEPAFSGDFIVTVYAVDNVGNESRVSVGTTEFALAVDIERILAPHDPIFKSGESGILHITTWGYAERVEVEFPKEMLELNPDLNQVYVYTDSPAYRQEESLQFMIPLYTPENEEYVITVRAYKGDRQLEDHPGLGVISISGTVLDDIRTRLR